MAHYNKINCWRYKKYFVYYELGIVGIIMFISNHTYAASINIILYVITSKIVEISDVEVMNNTNWYEYII